jgi:hypothetical protein
MVRIVMLRQFSKPNNVVIFKRRGDYETGEKKLLFKDFRQPAA